MTATVADLPVTADECLARYIFQKNKRDVRPDGTIKPDPFIPFKYVELSVTRHRGLNESQIWSIGDMVAEKVGSKLHGRADRLTAVFVSQNLQVVAAPEDGNPNHANVIGWPLEKQAQKEIALEVAKGAKFTARIS